MYYGSLQNQVFANCKNTTTPEVGLGATAIWYSDRSVYTIVEVSKSGRSIVVQEDDVVADKSKPLGIGHQDWIITPNPNAPRIIVTLRSNGKWVIKGQGQKNGQRFLIGARDYYYDWTF